MTFVPVQAGNGTTATGTTDAEGKYRLTAMKPGCNPAAPAPERCRENTTSASSKVRSPEHTKSTEEAMPKPGEQRPKGGEITHVVPQKYGNPQESGIKKTVKEGKNDIPIELTSK